MPNLIGERRRPMPPPPAPSGAAPGVWRDLFHLFYQVEIRHRRPHGGTRSREAKWRRRCDTIMAILSSLFQHDNVGASCLIPPPPQALSRRLDAESPVAQKG